ncbi:hypothetical protein Acor_81600 [Acrocarpospora corrugata]|uniref:Uncharacterized protein n=1 Tax=Acrocarpospora corrugata TaxID=35763 RepID=A0A5M3WG72_9ACTN|nr:hypothetical protein Acor_81600 [Acrocarpospora corrugata]
MLNTGLERKHTESMRGKAQTPGRLRHPHRTRTRAIQSLERALAAALGLRSRQLLVEGDGFLDRRPLFGQTVNVTLVDDDSN